MNTDHDTTNIVRSWLREDEHASADRIVDDVLDRVDSLQQRPVRWFPARLPVMSPMVRFALATVAVTVLAVITINLLPRSGGVGGPPPPVSSEPAATATPSGPEPANILGLPPEGAVPSDTTSGQLVLRFDSSSYTRADTILVYADGRIISAPFLSTPAGVGDAYTGGAEQHLTADGVAFLRSQVAASGLFADDLDLARESGDGYFEVDLRTGDRFVRVTWAWPGATDAPVATAEQVAAIQSINDLFRDQSSWPASAWEDDTLTAYVPSSYAVCFGVRPVAAGPGEWAGPVDPAEVWALLPESAQVLLGAGEPTTEQDTMHADAGCTLLTTDDARALAQSFQGSAVHRSQPESRYFVAYELWNPKPDWNLIWIQFGPVLPNGVTWLGPG